MSIYPLGARTAAKKNTMKVAGKRQLRNDEVRHAAVCIVGSTKLGLQDDSSGEDSWDKLDVDADNHGEAASSGQQVQAAVKNDPADIARQKKRVTKLVSDLSAAARQVAKCRRVADRGDDGTKAIIGEKLEGAEQSLEAATEYYDALDMPDHNWIHEDLAALRVRVAGDVKCLNRYLGVCRTFL